MTNHLDIYIYAIKVVAITPRSMTNVSSLSRSRGRGQPLFDNLCLINILVNSHCLLKNVVSDRLFLIKAPYPIFVDSEF